MTARCELAFGAALLVALASAPAHAAPPPPTRLEASRSAAHAHHALRAIEPRLSSSVANVRRTLPPPPANVPVVTTFHDVCPSGGTFDGKLSTSVSGPMTTKVYALVFKSCNMGTAYFDGSIVQTITYATTTTSSSTITVASLTLDGGPIAVVLYDADGAVSQSGDYTFQHLSATTTVTTPSGGTPTSSVAVSGTFTLGGATYQADPSTFAVFGG